jgi:hypothetical protein
MRRQNVPRRYEEDAARGYEDFGLFNYRVYRRLRGLRSEDEESPWPIKRPEFVGGTDRLVASSEGESLLCLRGLAIQPVRTPGFTGIIDLDTAVVDASRSRTVNADLSGVLDAARQAVAPQVVENLNALRAEGLIVQKTAFIGSCVRLYGDQVIMDSDVPWASELKLPGNVEVINSKELLSKVENVKAIFIAYNTGPWTAMKLWVGGPMFAGDKEMAILIDGEGQPTPPYRSGGTATGSLIDLWKEFSNSGLFAILIRIVAQAWQASPEQLAQQQNWTGESDRISGWCTRSVKME